MRSTHDNDATAPPRSARLRLDLLHAFEAAARHRSFTKAGAELFLSQSAVSRQLQTLEANLGTALFERTGRTLALTAAGAVMLRAVEDSLARLGDAATLVRGAAAKRQVAITCTPGFASFWLIPRLARFTEGRPEVDVRISANHELVDLARANAAIDLAVRFVPHARGSGPMLFEEEVQPMCSPALARSKQRPLRTPADLSRHTLLIVDLPQGAGGVTMDWEPWLRIMRLDRLESLNTIRFSQYSEAVAAACEGQGVVIGRLPLLAELVAAGRLVTPFASPAASRRGYYVELAPHAATNADALDFARWLEDESARSAGEETAARTTPRRAAGARRSATGGPRIGATPMLAPTRRR